MHAPVCSPPPFRLCTQHRRLEELPCKFEPYDCRLSAFIRLISAYSKSTASLQATQKLMTPPALKSPLVPLVRVSPMLLVSLSGKHTLRPSSTSPDSSLSTTTPLCSLAMDALWKVLPARLLLLLVTCSSAT